MKKVEQSDIPIIHEWQASRNLPLDPLPPVGFVVEGVAAGFLYETSGSFCFLDSYIANPDSTKMERKLALDEITDALLSVAKEKGFLKVIALTKNKSVKNRCENTGFNCHGQFDVYVKEL